LAYFPSNFPMLVLSMIFIHGITPFLLDCNCNNNTLRQACQGLRRSKLPGISNLGNIHST